MTSDETKRLLTATRTGPAFRGMAGEERELLYALTLSAGLRWSELRSLTRSSFHLDVVPATVTVSAGYSKHRHEDVLPLRQDILERLRIHLASRLPNCQAFDMPLGGVGAEMMREDLARAEIPYQTDLGVCDFHSLRHTFITSLAVSGVHPSVAQRLARHSTVELTLGVYTHIRLENQAEALESLPSIFTNPTADVSVRNVTDNA
ncbi:MAG TPA: site-specific integrase [Candidatus Brocadiia bacterium]|nr:site-specific integrase [Candidatus Brocadiia bacterium]